MAVPVVGRRQPQAGRRAEAKYRELLANWQRRVLPTLRWMLWPVIALGLIGAALPGTWKWAAGLLCGAGLAMWWAWRDDAPWRIVKWHIGAEGERKTEKCLDVLKADGWYIAHDLPYENGNLDHVVIGPAGVFLLDTKVWGGHITVNDDGVPTVTPIYTPDDSWSNEKLAGRMRHLALALNGELRSRTNIRRWVQPVVVLWSPFEEGVKDAGGVVFVHGTKLVAWLQSRGEAVSGEEQGRLTLAVAELADCD